MTYIYIAGAHSRATTMAHYLCYLNPEIQILAYLYNNEEENPIEINGVPVVKIDENSILDIDASVYLGTRGVNHAHLIETLTKCGMKNIIPVDVQLDLEIRNEYLKKYYASIGREYSKIDDLSIMERETYDNSATIYVATSLFDRPLTNPNGYVSSPYEKTLQVGSALSNHRMQADFFDNIGDNISNMNTQFCELTGLYWIWKHANEDIVGLVHYRRHFILPENWIQKMMSNNVDVILPLPLYVNPSIEENYRNRHIPNTWDAMINALKMNSPTDYEKALKFFSETSLYSPCNMFIMKREIVNDLCEWMFPILIDITKSVGNIDDNYQNRYPGFISERLITYFFEHNRNKYRVVYADKNFLT